MKLPQGLEKVHFIEFDPKNEALDLQPGMTDSKGYGMQGVTKMASVTAPSGLVPEGALADDAKTVSIVIAQAGRSAWPAGLASQAGDRPAVELSLLADGKPLSAGKLGERVLVAVPYVPAAQELAQPHRIVVRTVDADGRATAIPNARYDAKTGMVYFTVNTLGVAAASCVRTVTRPGPKSPSS